MGRDIGGGGGGGELTIFRIETTGVAYFPMSVACFSARLMSRNASQTLIKKFGPQEINDAWRKVWHVGATAGSFLS